MGGVVVDGDGDAVSGDAVSGDAVGEIASPYVTYSERYGLVKLPLWVIDNLTNPGATMYDEKVERIWFEIVEACRDAREVHGE